MKKIVVICLLLVATVGFSQKKEKIKGSKVVTHTIKEIASFSAIEIEGNLEVFLVKSDTPSVEIEADDNLHDVIDFSVTANTLRIKILKRVIGAKKFSLRINYNNSLNLITVKDNAVLNAISPLEVTAITIKNYDKSSSFLNVENTKLKLILNDKSTSESNIKGNTATIEINQSASLKAFINNNETKIDIYQRGNAKINGTTKIINARIDNSSQLIAEEFVTEKVNLTIESYAKATIHATELFTLQASGKSSVSFYGNAKIIIEKFANTTSLKKR